MADDDLRLQVGEPIQLEMLSDKGQQRHTVKVIGYVPHRSILVTMPRVGGKVVMMREGLVMNARLLTNNRAMGFTTSLLRAPLQPYPYMHLSYPRDLQATVVRSSHRVAVNLVVAIRTQFAREDSNEMDEQAIMVDISLGGALLQAVLPLGTVGQTITLATRLVVAEMERFLTLEATIRSIRAQSGVNKLVASHYIHGVEFLPMPPHEKLVVHGFVCEQIIASLI